MNHHSPNKFIATKYCFLILVDDTSVFFFLYLFFVFMLFCCYQKIYVYIFYSIVFHENVFYFFMFRGVPECSVFLVLLTPDSNAANY